MKSSIALASFNGARFIGEQLDSFAAQTTKPGEVVICDDGSTDETVEIAERFARTAPFPVSIHRNAARLGYSRNFEIAIGRCSGDIIFLSDQDDVWFPDRIETVLARFETADEALAVVNDQLLAGPELEHSGVTKLDNLRRLGLTSDGLIEGCCTAFRRDWAEMLLPMPEEAEELLRIRALSHDRWINQLSILLGVREVIDRPLQYFRRYGANTTSWIVSEPRPVSRRHLLSTRLKHAPVESWLQRVRVLHLYRTWLLDHRRRLEERGIRRCDAALEALERERSSLEARAELVGLPLAQRLPKIWHLWRRGGYRFFYGWKSAVRDVSRTS
jgi:glycosyltransferase involved in cell wall biosynthesis